jgi:iron(III) transport system substrate-binding protein
MRQTRETENRVAFCLTDTDDAWKAIEEGFPVRVVYPDQGDDARGTVLIPNTIALVKGHPHPEAAVKLLTWLTSAENEARLAAGPSAQIPLRSDMGGATVPDHVKRPGVDFRAMVVDWQQVGENRDRWLDYLNKSFRPVE